MGLIPLFDTIHEFFSIFFNIFSTLSIKSFQFQLNKLFQMDIKCVFLGYPFGVKGYQVMDLHTHLVFISRNVQFHESIFPFQSQVPSQSIDPFDTCFDFVSLPVLPTPLLNEHTPIPLNPDSPIADTATATDTATAADCTTTNCTNSEECISSQIPPSTDTHVHS